MTHIVLTVVIVVLTAFIGYKVGYYRATNKATQIIRDAFIQTFAAMGEGQEKSEDSE